MSSFSVGKRYFAVVLLGATVLSSADSARATEGLYFDGIGARSVGMGGTGYAHDIGGAAMIVNPATLGAASRSYVEGGLTVPAPNRLTVRNTATGEEITDPRRPVVNAYYIPQVGLVHRRDDLTLGVGIYSPGGFGTNLDNDGFLSRLPSGVDTGLEIESRALFARIPVAASYRVAPWVTVGGAVDAVYTGLSVRELYNVDQVGALVGSGRASGSLIPNLVPVLGMGGGAYLDFSKDSDYRPGVDGWGVSGRLGATFRVMAGTTIGMAYQAKTNVGDMTGSGRAIAIAPNGAQVVLPGKYTIRDFSLPAEAGIGIAQAIGDRWTVAADFRRTFWASSFEDIKIRFAANGGGDLSLDIPQNFRDVNSLGLGVAFKATDALTLRGGARLASKAVPNDTLTPLIPAVVRKHVSVGASYALTDSAVVDAAYSVGLRESVENDAPPNTSVVAPVGVSSRIDNLTLTLRYSF